MSSFKGSAIIFAVLSILCALGANVADDTASTTLTFERTCNEDHDCYYEIGMVGGIRLTCKSGKCECQKTPLIYLDGPNFDVRVLNGKCLSSRYAPCGTTNGITIECDEGSTCIEDRCRSTIRTVPKGSHCHEDIDCQEGLICKHEQFYEISISKCERK